ncbi:MAG: DSD1 family PLP-dependent enzyme [Eubacteriales bacterium]|nr:DSD1 family PLP-dependent enzyme [Eubacteriales bacterium]
MHIEQIETPALILDLDIMERNMDAMDKLLEGSSARLRPHYKSNKCTAIAHMQMARGAKGICCAKLSEAEDLVLAGIPDVLIANQITEPSKIARLAYLAGCCRLTVCVDNSSNINDLQKAAALQSTIIHCLVEYDIGMNRCGVHTKEEFSALARQVMDCPNLVFDGIQAYAGNLAHQEDYGCRARESDRVEAKLMELIACLEEQGISVEEVSGVSTGTLEFHVKDTVYTELQPGSYLFMDAAYRAVGVSFEHSLFVLASVVSRAGGGVITDAGLKSVSVDQRSPRFVGYETYEVDMSEEHCAIYGKDLPQKVGDRMLLIPSHCCTTVNLHDHICFVRDGRVVDRVPVTGRGHSR